MNNPAYRLITTGAESSGKTTLATQLAQALPAPLVSEASRPYLEKKYKEDPQFQYQEQDLLNIAQQQLNQEQETAEHSDTYLVCDTDLLVILIWSEVKFGHALQALTNLFETTIADTNRHYLLCDWQIPWQPDPLRENPHDRDMLFQHYLAKLMHYNLPFTLIEGSPQQRLKQALAVTTTLIP